jgi:hypothetical protein
LAALARPAGDLERNHNPITHREAIGSFDHFSDALVAEVDRHRERGLPEDHGLVEVARGDGQRPHDRLALVPALGVGDVVPGQAAGVFEYERAHLRSP